MGEISIELILLTVLGLVFIVDFVLKGIKKSSSRKREIILFKEPSKKTKASRGANKFLQYIIQRPRNITMYLFIVTLIKLMVHFLIFTENYSRRIRKTFDLRQRNSFSRDPNEYITSERPFKYYFENLFNPKDHSEFLTMWAISILVTTFLAWQLNPYIKKR